MTDEKLQAIKARAENATPAHIVFKHSKDYPSLISANGGDIRFLKRARKDILALVAEVERLRDDQAEWRKGVAFIASSAGVKTLSCSHLGMEVLKIRADNESLQEKLDATQEAKEQ